MTLTARAPRPSWSRALLLGAGLVLAGSALVGCARPGQLGRPPAPPAAAAPAAVVQPAPAPAAPGTAAPEPEPVTGTLDSRVSIRTPGPAVYSVRTVVLAPGESLGWHRHPGTELAVVRTGDVTLVRQGACAPVGYGSGDALFIGDAVPYRLTNGGAAPAELLVTMLLAPGAAESTKVEPACGAG